MTADVRDRILGLLTAGPATVARLSAGLGVPGGVVSYELKLLERDGLVRVGTTRREHGVPTPLYVSTAAAAPPALPVPDPIPGLTWIADEPYPTPLWTVPHPPGSDAARTIPSPAGEDDKAAAGDGPAAPGDQATPSPESDAAAIPTEAGRDISGRDISGRDISGRDFAESGAAETTGAERTDDDLAATEETSPGGRRLPTRPRASPAEPTGEPTAPSPASRRFPRPRRVEPESSRGPRLHEVRRVPMDDATFYEFAERLDALAREFAARATPGAPPTELTILLTRPATGTAGYGS